MDAYHALANAIVELAVKDYKTALKYHYVHPDKCGYTADVDSLERFFRSGWYGTLTDLDGGYLMRNVQALVRKEVGV